MTVPRIELLGILLISTLVSRVLRAFETELLISKLFCWTDSHIALAWIKDDVKEFKPWIDNRLVKVRENVAAENYYYVWSHANPADLITRHGNDISMTIWFKNINYK